MDDEGLKSIGTTALLGPLPSSCRLLQRRTARCTRGGSGLGGAGKRGEVEGASAHMQLLLNFFEHHVAPDRFRMVFANITVSFIALVCRSVTKSIKPLRDSSTTHRHRRPAPPE